MMNEEEKKKLGAGIVFVSLLAVILIVIGIGLVTEAFAVNQTAIDEIQAELQDELDLTNSFSVFWVIFLLVMLAVFMAVYLRMRESRESVFFSIGATIVTIVLLMVFTSPLDFDFNHFENYIVVEEIEWLDGNVTYNSSVKNTVNQVVVIPGDSEFRLVLSFLFTGLMIFNALYSIFIVTNFPFGGGRRNER